MKNIKCYMEESEYLKLLEKGSDSAFWHVVVCLFSPPLDCELFKIRDYLLLFFVSPVLSTMPGT